METFKLFLCICVLVANFRGAKKAGLLRLLPFTYNKYAAVQQLFNHSKLFTNLGESSNGFFDMLGAVTG